MMTPEKIELAQQIAIGARALSLADANEAETRLKLINRVLFELLGWEHADVRVEERVSEDGRATYADYIFRTANVAICVEAKKVGAGFSGMPSVRRLKLSNSALKSSFGDSVRQARDYCRKMSIPFAVVTNGDQWALFPASRSDQVPFADSTAIIFSDLQSTLGSELREFYGLLARSAVVAGDLEVQLVGRTEDQLDERRLAPFFQASSQDDLSNPILPLIEDAVANTFTESATQMPGALLEQCYVKDADRTKFDSRIRMHLSRQVVDGLGQSAKPMRKRAGASFVDAIGRAEKSGRPMAVLVLGTVGAGKTTFLDYTRHVAGASVFERPDSKEPHAHWIPVDFRNQPPSNKDAAQFIFDQISRYVSAEPFFRSYEACISKAYASDLQALRTGILSLVADDEEKLKEQIVAFLVNETKDAKKYNSKLIEYAASKAPVFLVVDNIDQLEDEDDQSRVFADSMAIARSLGLSLVVAMRESTYVRHRGSPTFDAFDFDTFLIEPPDIAQVLAKRFFVATEILRGRSGRFTADNGFEIKIEDLSDYMELVRASVLGTEVGNRVRVIANGDVRLALRMTRHFLERGYTDPAKAIEVYKNNGEYRLPPHEAFKAILLGSRQVYSEKFSDIGNPFDARLSRTGAQLLRMFVLSALVRHSSEAAFVGLDGTEIRDRLRTIGFSDENCQVVLRDLCSLRFVQTQGHGAAEFAASFSPTRLGGYVLRDLTGDLTFVENVLKDTFIPEKAVWDSMRKRAASIDAQRNPIARLELRVEQSKEFMSLMETLYAPLADEAAKRGLPAEWIGNPVSDQRRWLDRDCASALESANRNYGGPGRARR